MKLFYQDSPPAPQKIHEITSKGYGIKHPERINGYDGAFLFRVPDVYITDKISQVIDINPWFADRLRGMLKQFFNNDYGFVTSLEHDDNVETRYLSFSSSWMIGRYGSKFGGVVFETFYDISLFYFMEEDTNQIRKEQVKKEQEYYRSKG